MRKKGRYKKLKALRVLNSKPVKWIVEFCFHKRCDRDKENTVNKRSGLDIGEEDNDMEIISGELDYT